MYVIPYIIAVISITATFGLQNNGLGDNGCIVYSRNTLFNVRDSLTAEQNSSLLKELDFEGTVYTNNTKSKKRKRGTKGGLRTRFRRRKFRPPLPSVITGNVRSIRNKTEELCALCRFHYEYRESSLICLTETWLNDLDNDGSIDIDGFTVLRCDRNLDVTNKKSGGGVCIYVNERWCKNITVKEKYCDKNIELLTVSLRPFYLPREMNNIFCTVVYIPPCESDRNLAVSKIQDIVENIENENPDAVNIITGDFNHTNLEDILPNYEQAINCCTRDNATLDLFYCNINNSYKASIKAPLGDSDHNMIHLLPSYRQKLKSSKPVTKTINVFPENAIEDLRDKLEATDWSVLCNATNRDENVSVLPEYINFCFDQ